MTGTPSPVEGAYPAIPGPADRHGRLAPSPEVLRAIEQAVAQSWPKGGARLEAPEVGPARRWRFSGRWFTGPLPVSRARPWRP